MRVWSRPCGLPGETLTVRQATVLDQAMGRPEGRN